MAIRKLRYFCLLLVTVLALVIVCPRPGHAQTDAERAALLTSNGKQWLDQGHPGAAFETWQTALTLYRQLKNSEGISGTLINQSIALQHLGQFPRACSLLVESLTLEGWICYSQFDPADFSRLKNALQNLPHQPLVLLGLKNLGDVLRQLGYPEASVIVLNTALAQSPANALAQDLRLSLANAEAEQYLLSRQQALLSSNSLNRTTANLTALKWARSALNNYQSLASPPPLGIKADLNWLSLYLKIVQWEGTTDPFPDLTHLVQKYRSQLPVILQRFTATPWGELSAIESIYDRLNLASSLRQLHQFEPVSSGMNPDRSPLRWAFDLSLAALQDAQQLQNWRAQSLAYGSLGQLYRESQQLSQAETALVQARDLALSIRAVDAAYQWQWELGRLYLAQGRRSAAITAYTGAIASLDAVRNDLRALPVSLQFSFRESVEPVYRELMGLLAKEPNADWEIIANLNEQLRLTELENYLRCGRLKTIPMTSLLTRSPDVVLLHVLDLGNSIELIARTNQKILHYSPDARELRQQAQQLSFYLQNRNFLNLPPSTFLPYAQALHRLLLSPLEAKGFIPQGATLVFVSDPFLQGIPPAILHDQRQYLIEKYNLAVGLGGQFLPTAGLRQNSRQVLMAAISQQSPSFDSPDVARDLTPLPEVVAEAQAIKSILRTKVLLDQSFTVERFKQTVTQGQYPIIHISTHGQFSSDPEQTLLLAWDQPIRVDALRSILEARRPGAPLLDLLFLSACQTATGDERSTLGLAGIAVQSGAASTIATLWVVEATSTTQVAEQFYAALQAGKTKAQSLRQAQLSLINNPKWSHPYYWSGIILVGNWT